MKKTLIVGVLSITALATAACSGQPGATAAGDSGSANYATGGTFNLSIPSDPGSLDPLKAVKASTNEILRYAYDSLVATTVDGKIVPSLASSWTGDAKNLTFHINPAVRCDDGSALKPTDIAANFEWMKNPKNASGQIGVTVPDRDFTVSADDAAGTFTLSLGKPFGFILRALSEIPIACASGLSNEASMEQGTAGTGPFKLISSKAGSEYTFEARHGYTWGPSGATTAVPGFPKTLVFKVISDNTTAANLLLSGGLSAARVEDADKARLASQGFFSADNWSTQGQIYFNQNSGHPAHDTGFRVALARALEFDKIMAVTSGGAGKRPVSMAVELPRGCSNDSVTGNIPSYDVQAASAALDALGWQKGPDGIRQKNGKKAKFVFLTQTDVASSVKAGQELIAKSWHDALGIDIEVRPLTQSSVVDAIFKSDDWDAVWLTLNSDLSSRIKPFVSGAYIADGGSNFGRVANSAYDKLSAEASLVTGDAACVLWTEAESALVRDADVLQVSMVSRTRFGNHARFDAIVSPTSLRVLK